MYISQLIIIVLAWGNNSHIWHFQNFNRPIFVTALLTCPKFQVNWLSRRWWKMYFKMPHKHILIHTHTWSWIKAHKKPKQCTTSLMYTYVIRHVFSICKLYKYNSLKHVTKAYVQNFQTLNIPLAASFVIYLLLFCIPWLESRNTNNWLTNIEIY